MIEGIMTLSGGEDFPLSLSGGWLFYGSDYSKPIAKNIFFTVGLSLYNN